MDRSEYNKQYWIKNKTKLKEINKQYYLNDRENQVERSRKYRKDNPQKVKESNKRARIKNGHIYNQNRNKRHGNNLEMWRDFVFKKDKCEICGKKLYYNRGSQKAVVNFDHKKENVSIKSCPTDWLEMNKNRRSPEKEKIWESCNFGILCSFCNSSLPTKNREQFVINVIKYVFGGG